MRLRTAVIVVLGLGLLATIVVATVPNVAVAYENPRLHLAVLSAEAWIGLLAAFLVLGRVRRWKRSDDLLLCCGLAVLALSNLCFGLLPAVMWSEAGHTAIWCALLGRLSGCALIAAAALLPARRIRLTRRTSVFSALGVVEALAAVGLGVWLLGGALPPVIEATPPDPTTLEVRGDPLVALTQAISAVLFALAAIGFARRSERMHDGLTGGFALACALAAVARVNYVLFPSVYTDWVSLGDLFRLLFYLVILGAAFMEIERHWVGAIKTAALQERRRIARDLHDGLAQELSSIRRNLHWLDEDDPVVERLTRSSERALGEARRAITVLSDEGERPLAQAIREVTGVVAEREGMELELELDATVKLKAEERRALVLIAAEAITNAARHGGAHAVRVELVDRPRVRLRVSDEGTGFHPRPSRAGIWGGYGMVGMHQRADSIGARLRVDSSPGRGTQVEVAL